MLRRMLRLTVTIMVIVDIAKPLLHVHGRPDRRYRMGASEEAPECRKRICEIERLEAEAGTGGAERRIEEQNGSGSRDREV